MSYASISNLYKDQIILLFRECYALEKIHGTKAHVSWRDGKVWLSAGGESAVTFAACFDQPALAEAFKAIGHEKLTVHGEAYGGKQQGQSWRYGDKHRFVAFDVKVDDKWLSIPHAEAVVHSLGLEFVHYAKVSTDLAALDAERDAPSEQARRNGVVGDQPREGVVLRPLIELTMNNGERVCAKHKRDEERETATPRKVVDPMTQVVLDEAGAIADEWVVPTRLQHVLQKLPPGIGMESTPLVISAMIEDVLREAKGEIVDSKAARGAISRRTADLFKKHVKSALREKE